MNFLTTLAFIRLALNIFGLLTWIERLLLVHLFLIIPVADKDLSTLLPS